MKRPHDMGGDPAGPVDTAEHTLAPWEKRTDAILRLVAHPERKLMTVDELRRGVEDLGPGVYDDLSYYERWISSMTNILTQKGVFTVAELGERMAAVDERWKRDKAEKKADTGA